MEQPRRDVNEFSPVHRKRRRRQRCQEKNIQPSWKSRTYMTAFSLIACPTVLYTDAFVPSPPVSGPVSTLNRQTSSLDMVQTYSKKGLSRYFQSILRRTNDRQRFVTGQYPVVVSFQENPTQQWLNKDRATYLLFVNDTMIDQSLASYDRFQWLDEPERQALHDRYASVSLELLAEINMSKPGYIQILSSLGAGSSAETTRTVGSATRWNRWKNSALYEEVILGESKHQPKFSYLNGHHDAAHGLEDSEDRSSSPAKDRLWVTGFSLAGRKGIIKSMDVDSGHVESVNGRSEAMTLWPNEINSVPSRLVPSQTSDNDKLQSLHPDQLQEEDALLISDGFLVPGKDRGGLYVVKNPGNKNSEWTTCISNLDGDRWFYHRAVWVDLTGDGRLSILTARAKLRKVKGRSRNTADTANSSCSEQGSRPKNGQLVMLEMPKPHHYDPGTGTPLEGDGTTFDPFSARHLPWKERVLATGPDVIFNVADLDVEDDTVEVIASQFFDKKVTLHSIQKGPRPRVTFSRVIDDRCGSAFGGILADLDPGSNPDYRRVVDAGSTVDNLKRGSSFSHVLVTSHECNYAEADSEGLKDTQTKYMIDGGSVFSYRVPEGKDTWKTEPWTRTTVATGFKVKGQIWNMINPGAPGFLYTFHAKREDAEEGKRPMIAVAGDCAESAYIFRPEKGDPVRNQQIADPQAQYRLMTEIKCGATVGSIGIGYEDLCDVEQESGYAKIYIPCYEKDKILVFAMGSGETDGDNNDGMFTDDH